MRRVVWAGKFFGIRDGYDGFLEPRNYPDGGLIELRRSTGREIFHLGGTILGTTNRGNPFCRPTSQADGTIKEVRRSASKPTTHDFVPIQQAIARLKLIPQDSEFVLVPRALDISFGDGD